MGSCNNYWGCLMCINCESVAEELECENTSILDELGLEIYEHVMELVRKQEFYNNTGVILH